MKLFFFLIFITIKISVAIIILWLYYRGIMSIFTGHWLYAILYILGAIITNIVIGGFLKRG